MSKVKLKTAESDPTMKSEPAVSICPKGEAFPLPQPAEYGEEFKRLERIVEEQRIKGREIVVVMGVGFVGAVMAGVVADSTAKNGAIEKFVIGMQRPSVQILLEDPLPEPRGLRRSRPKTRRWRP